MPWRRGWSASVEQVRFGLGDQLGVEIARVARRGRGGWPRPARRGPGPVARAGRVRSWASRPWASRIVRCAAGAGGPGAVGVPVRGRGGPGLRREARSGRRGRGGGTSSSASCALGGLDLVEGRGGLGGVHRPDRDLGQVGELVAHASEHPGDRVWLVRDRCHGTNPSTRPPTLIGGRESLCG